MSLFLLDSRGTSLLAVRIRKLVTTPTIAAGGGKVITGFWRSALLASAMPGYGLNMSPARGGRLTRRSTAEDAAL
jgi:hypothetical protein